MAKWSCCLPTCVRWVVYNCILFSKAEEYFNKIAVILKEEKAHKHRQQTKQGSRRRCHSNTRMHSATKHSTGKQGTKGDQGRTASRTTQ